jgi:BirA family biotin operon repressor/biotin-[acetyl-CoA-carboxylase] ligase
LLRPNVKQENFPLFTLAAGVASAKAIEEVFGLTITLKWVNDLILERKKLGGILCELASSPQIAASQPAIIIGIGINLDLSTTDIPEDLQDKITWLYKATPNRATSNKKKVCDYKTSKYEIIAAILNNLEKLSDCISNGDHETVTQLWKKYSCTLGQEVIVSSGQAEKVIAGYAKDINDKGALILVDNQGKEHTIYAGDISIRNADGTYC